MPIWKLAKEQLSWGCLVWVEWNVFNVVLIPPISSSLLLAVTMEQRLLGTRCCPLCRDILCHPTKSHWKLCGDLSECFLQCLVLEVCGEWKKKKV